MKSLTAADRKSLIKLAATLEKGSPERQAILSGLKKAGSPDKGRLATEILSGTLATLENNLMGGRGEWVTSDGEVLVVKDINWDGPKGTMKVEVFPEVGEPYPIRVVISAQVR